MKSAPKNAKEFEKRKKRAWTKDFRSEKKVAESD